MDALRNSLRALSWNLALVKPEFESAIKHQGFLAKKSRHLGVWRARWTVLVNLKSCEGINQPTTDDRFFVITHDPSRAPTEHIRIDSDTVVAVYTEEEKLRGRIMPFLFFIENRNDGEMFVFQAQSTDDRDGWIDDIKKAIDHEFYGGIDANDKATRKANDKAMRKEEAMDFDSKLLRYIRGLHTPSNKALFRRIQPTAQRTKDTVIGYLRAFADEDSLIVPDVVVYVCLVFYHPKHDIFGAHGDRLTVDESRRMVTSPLLPMAMNSESELGSWNTVYGSCVHNLKDAALHEWSFEIGGLPNDNRDMIIGLIGYDSEPELKVNGNQFIDNKKERETNDCAYGYGTNGRKYHGVNKSYGDSFSTGDIIKVRLDTRQTTDMLIFYKNNKSQHIAFEKLGKAHGKVRLALSLFGRCSVTIVSCT
eukprot:6343_1